MLELIHDQKIDHKSKVLDAADESQSLLYINELIAQVNHVHSRQVWNAQMRVLMLAVEQAAQPAKRLKAL